MAESPAPLPPTTPALEARITALAAAVAELAKQLATGQDMVMSLSASIEKRLMALESRPIPATPPRRRGIFGD